MAKRALIVDDSALARHLVRRTISAAGFDVVGEARTGREGIELFRDLRPDLVTLDVVMPDGDGVAALREILRIDAGARVVMVSSVGDGLMASDLYRAGASSVLRKPFDPAKLLEVVHTILGEQTPADRGGVPPLVRALDQGSSDHLMEVANVGAGSAASKLSELTGRRCRISPPTIAHLDAEGIRTICESEDRLSTAILVTIMGDIPAVVAVIAPRVAAYRIVRYTTTGPAPATAEDRIAASRLALRRVGEALTAAFSDAVHELLRAKGGAVAWDVAVGTWSTALPALLARLGPPEETKLVMRCAFEDVEASFEGKILYILGRAGLESVRDRLGALLGGRP